MAHPNTLIRTLGLSTRAVTALAGRDYVRVQDVAAATDAELLRITNLGRVTLKEIRALIPHQHELTAVDRAIDLKARAAREVEGRIQQALEQALKQQELKHYKRIFYLEMVITKCAAQFRRFAAEARHGIGMRGFNEEDRRKLDDALTNDMLAGMCEEALKQ